jgi:hypothetical protein
MLKTAVIDGLKQFFAQEEVTEASVVQTDVSSLDGFLLHRGVGWGVCDVVIFEDLVAFLM